MREVEPKPAPLSAPDPKREGDSGIVGTALRPDSSPATLVESGTPIRPSPFDATLPGGGEADPGLAATIDVLALSASAPSAPAIHGSTLRPASIDASRLPFVDPASYSVAGALAQGGIGRILRARDQRLDRPVALKELLEPDSGAEERFVREALVTARLQHPGIVPVYEAGRWPSGEPFYAMKLVSGRSLAEIIDETKTLDQRLALLPHVLSVAEAMAYAHSEGIIHRDLKPANVLIGDFGETVVIDWGLAKDLRTGAADEPSRRGFSRDELHAPASENITMAGAIMGTPAFMPPEQAAGRPVDERADVYALGAILYHLLAGVCPYGGTTLRDILRQVLAGPPPPLPSTQAGIPPDLITIVDKAMAREAQGRYPTAKELADDLRRFQTGQIVGAHHYSRRERLARFTRRYRAPLVVAAFALVVLAVVSTASLLRVIDARRAAERERDRAEEERDRAAQKQAEAEEARRQAHQRADALTLVEAQAAAARDPNEAIAWLKSLSPSFDRWGEARLIAAEAESHGIARVLRGHKGALNNMAFSPDSRSIATASDDRTVRLWDMDGKLLRTLEGHDDEVWTVKFSPDGNHLASGSKDGTIRLWELHTGLAKVLRGHTGGVIALHFSPDGRQCVSKGRDDVARLWSVGTGESRILPGDPSPSWPAIFSPDGKTIAYIGQGKLFVWDVAGSRSRAFHIQKALIETMEFSPDGSGVAFGGSDGVAWLVDVRTGASRRLHKHANSITDIAFSPTGGTVLSASRDGLLGVFDLQAGTHTTLRGHEGQVYNAAVSPDGTQFASAGGDRTVRLWDVTTGRNRILGGFRDLVCYVGYSPDGKRVAATSLDHTARIWNREQLRDRILTRHEQTANRAIFSPDGRRIASAGNDGAIFATDLSTEGTFIVTRHDGPVHSIGFSNDGTKLISAGDDGIIRISNIADRRSVLCEGHQGPINEIAVSPDGSHFASGGKDGTVRLWNIAGDEVRNLEQRDGEVKCLAFALDGKGIASGDTNGTVRFWDVTRGESRILGKHQGPVAALAYSPDGHFLVSGAEDHTLRIWDAQRLEALHSIDASGLGITRIVFAADGKTFATAGQEAAIRVWETASGKSRAILRGHIVAVLGLSMSAEGTRIASSDKLGMLRIWDLQSGKSRALRGPPASLGWVSFSPDGKRIVSAGADGMVRLWKDDLPQDPIGLRAWLDTATPDSLADVGSHLQITPP